MAFTEANRATWQLIRRKATFPGSGSSQVVPSIAFGVRATFIGSRQSYVGSTHDFPGAPMVDIDEIGFLPPEAASVFAEGDTVRNLDKMTMWRVQQIQGYPTVCILYLKRQAKLAVDGDTN